MSLMSIIPAFPELFLTLIILILLIFGVFQKEDTSDDQIRAAKITTWLTTASLIFTIFMLLNLGVNNSIIFSGMFINDSFSIFCKILILGSGISSIIISRDFLERHSIAKFEYPILIMFSILGMMVMVSANDLISMYLGLEMQSLSLYILAAFRRDDERSVEAGLKYFVLGALASGMLLYGSSLIYGFTGTTNFQNLTESLTLAINTDTHLGLILGLVFILSGLCFKISAVPFHMWTPDVYEGAPTPVTAFFSVAPKIAALALIMRIMFGPFGGLQAEWNQIIIFISIASMLVGALAAINQKNIKRLMAYSSISHTGYALIGVAVGTEVGVQSVLVFLTIYIVMNIGTFSCILSMRVKDKMLENINDLAGLGETHPKLALSFTIFLFSLAGIPPLAGFAGKFVIFMGAISAKFYVLAIIGVLSSVISAFYYLRIVKIIYFDPSNENIEPNIERGIGIVVTISAIVTVLFLFYPTPIFTHASIAAASLLNGS